MGKYLLNAPDEDLAAWKQAAKDEGLTLAAWIRRHLTEVLWANQNKNLDGTALTSNLTEITADDLPNPLHDLPEERPNESQWEVDMSRVTLPPKITCIVDDDEILVSRKNVQPDPKPTKQKKKR